LYSSNNNNNDYNDANNDGDSNNSNNNNNYNNNNNNFFGVIRKYSSLLEIYKIVSNINENSGNNDYDVKTKIFVHVVNLSLNSFFDIIIMTKKNYQNNKKISKLSVEKVHLVYDEK
jgi:hypothetical protein